jgi:hypothetical protein
MALQYTPNDTMVFREPLGTVAFMSGTWGTPIEFTRSYGKLIAHAYENVLQPHQFIHLDDQPTSYHSAARNALARRFMGDWLLQLDTDHEFEPDMLARMLGITQKWSVDVLTAVYRLKVPPYLPNLYWWNEESQAFARIAEINWDQPVQEIKCSGAGALLVRRCVFDRIREELHEEPFDIIHPYSEDFSFFRRCIKLGIKTHVAPQIYSAHLRVTAVTHDDYNPAGLVLGPVDPATGTVQGVVEPVTK